MIAETARRAGCWLAWLYASRMELRYLAVILTIGLSSQVFAEEYFLEIEKVCSSTGNKLEFSCEKKTDERQLIFFENGKWYGRNPSNARELSVVRNDDFILVLDNPISFSGTDRIHLLKATGKFYWSQFAYSDLLEESEATVKYGSIVEVVK